MGYDFDFDLGHGKTVIRHILPDIGAIKLWLFNRQPRRWKEKIEIESGVRLSDLPAEEIKRRMVAKLLQWNLISRDVVPPELLPPPDGTIDSEE